MKRLVVLTLLISFVSADVLVAADVRLQTTLAKLRRGEPITIVSIGGSITTGFAASPAASAGWSALVKEWWDAKAAQTGSKITYYNQGVSGTDSAAASVRVDQHITAVGADFVAVEFAVNDQWLGPEVRKLTYEGVLRQILKGPKKPSALLLFLCEKGDTKRGQQDEQSAIGAYYGLTEVSYGDRFSQDVAAGKGRWDDLYAEGETIHPNSTGHGVIADYVASALEAAWKSLPPDDQIPPIPTLPVPLYSDAFEFTAALGSDNAKALTLDGWTVGSDVHQEWLDHGGAHEGWGTTQDGAELTLAVKGKIVGVFYAESAQYRSLDAWVDDGKKVLIPTFVSFRTGYLGWGFRVVAQGLSAGDHVLHVKARKERGTVSSPKYSGIVTVVEAGLQ